MSSYEDFSTNSRFNELINVNTPGISFENESNYVRDPLDARVCDVFLELEHNQRETSTVKITAQVDGQLRTFNVERSHLVNFPPTIDEYTFIDARNNYIPFLGASMDAFVKATTTPSTLNIDMKDFNQEILLDLIELCDVFAPPKLIDACGAFLIIEAKQDPTNFFTTIKSHHGFFFRHNLHIKLAEAFVETMLTPEITTSLLDQLIEMYALLQQNQNGNALNRETIFFTHVIIKTLRLLIQESNQNSEQLERLSLLILIVFPDLRLPEKTLDKLKHLLQSNQSINSKSHPCAMSLKILYLEANRQVTIIDVILQNPSFSKFKLPTILLSGIQQLLYKNYDEAIRIYTALLDQNPNCELAKVLRADCFLANGNEQEFLNAVSDIKQTHSLSLSALQLTGSLHFKRQDYNQALPDLDNLLRSNKSNSKALTHRAICSLSMYQKDLAISDLQAAIRYEPTNIVALTTLSRCLYEQKDYESAHYHLEAAFKVEKTTEVLTLQAMVLYKQKKFQEGYKKAKKAVRIDRNNLPAVSLRAHLAAKLGKTEKAFLDFNDCLKANPLDQFARIKKSALHFHLKQFTPSIEELLTAYKAQPQNPYILRRLGDNYAALDEPIKAISYYNFALVQRPIYLSVMASRAQIHFKEGHYNHALNDCLKILELDKKNKQALYIAAKLNYQLGLENNQTSYYQYALRTISAYISQDDKNADAFVLRGLILARINKSTPELLEDFKKALEICHTHAEALAALAEYSNRLNLPEAYNLLQQAIALDNSNDKTYSIVASYHLQKKEYFQAIVFAKASLSLNPQNGYALRVRGAAHQCLGQYEDAEKDLIASLQYLKDNSLRHAKGLLAKNYFAWANCCKDNDDFKYKISQALAVYDQIESTKDNHSKILRNIGHCYLMLKDYPRALEALTYSEMLESSADTYYIKCLYYMDMEDYQTALQEIENGLAINPKHKKLLHKKPLCTNSASTHTPNSRAAASDNFVDITAFTDEPNKKQCAIL